MTPDQFNRLARHILVYFAYLAYTCTILATEDEQAKLVSLRKRRWGCTYRTHVGHSTTFPLGIR
jgi:hypothetical protein